MSVDTFLGLLFIFSVLGSMVTQVAKKAFQKVSSTLIAIVIGLIIGIIGTFVFYILNGMPIGLTEIVFAILLSLASGLSSTVEYDALKKVIEEAAKIGK